jgi:hypothetical protein
MKIGQLFQNVKSLHRYPQRDDLMGLRLFGIESRLKVTFCFEKSVPVVLVVCHVIIELSF